MRARPDWPPTRALACLYSAPHARAVLAALCGIERELGATLTAGLDHQVAHARLNWWREECERCLRGEATHPLTRALLANVAPAERGRLAGLAGVVDTATWDLAAATFTTRRELDAYCSRWSGAMLEPLAPSPASAGRTRSLGAALRATEILLALAGDARAGRIRLPLDELARAGCIPEGLARPPYGAALEGLLRARHRAARAALAAEVAALAPAERSALRGVMVWAALLARQSQRAERALPREGGPHEHHAALDGWRAWRAARRAAAGDFALPAD